MSPLVILASWFRMFSTQLPPETRFRGSTWLKIFKAFWRSLFDLRPLSWPHVFRPLAVLCRGKERGRSISMWSFLADSILYRRTESTPNPSGQVGMASWKPVGPQTSIFPCSNPSGHAILLGAQPPPYCSFARYLVPKTAIHISFAHH